MATTGSHKIDLDIDGMSCASCVGRVEKALNQVAGVDRTVVNLASERATVFYEGELNTSHLEAAVAAAGYKARVATKIIEKSLTEQKRRVLASAFFTLPLVIPMLGDIFHKHWMLPPLFQLVLAAIVQFYFGWRFYQSSGTAILHKAANMDLLVALGTSAAFFLSLSNIHRPGAHLYFESSAAIITLVLLGKYLEAMSKQQTTEAIRALQKLAPQLAHVERGGQELSVRIEDVQKGDVLIVRAGEQFPADGVVVRGTAFVDESLITGESRPVAKKAGDFVITGSLNQDGALYVQVTASGVDTALARIIRLVENAQIEKAPIQKLVDQVSAYFVPIVLLTSLVTFCGWLFWGATWSEALVHAVAVMVIACPCALGLATPTALVVGIGSAARYGILIKDALALELARSITVVAFDKTGTLTKGQPRVTSIFHPQFDRASFLRTTASVQAASSHPLARAVVHLAEGEKIQMSPVEQITNYPGRGVIGVVEGQKYLLGTKEFILENNISLRDIELELNQALNSGFSYFIVANQSSAVAMGLVILSDSLKEEAKGAIALLHQLSIKTVLLTGDNSSSAREVARALKIDEVHASLKPEEKLKILEEYKKSGEIISMVGDGINDAPALAVAHVGMAMSSGSDVAMQIASVTLLRGDLTLVPRTIQMSRLTYSKIRQNLFWAFIYNVLGIPLAALGYLNPMIAGAAMALSSFSVVSNSLLLRRKIHAL